MRKRLPWLAVAVVVAGAAGYLAWSHSRPAAFTPTPSGVTRANFERIEVGMTEAEVERILGGPPGVYTNRPDIQAQSGISFRRFWYGDEGNIVIEVGRDFDEPQSSPRRVRNKRFVPADDLRPAR